MKRARILLVFSLIYANAVWPFAATDCAELTRTLTDTVKTDRKAVALIPSVPKSLEKLLETTAEELETKILRAEQVFPREELKPTPATVERALRRCFNRTGKLLAMSSAVTASVRMGMDYVDHVPGGMLKQLSWNAALMTLVGMSACYKSQWGDNSVGTAAGVSSAVVQMVAQGRISVPDVVLDTAWVRLVSIRKSRFVMNRIDDYKQAGGARPDRREYLYQGISEGLGAGGIMLTQWALHTLMKLYGF